MSTAQRTFIAVFGLIAIAQIAHADSPSVTAVLNSSEAEVGETVQLEIRVTAARAADAPEEIVVDGLEIHRTGTSQRIEMNNLSLTSSVVYDYTVMPLRAGTFTIPPQTIRIGNSSLRTPALTLNVTDSSGRQSGARSGRDTRPATANNLVFAELIVPSKTAYVGEIVPVQIRMGFDPRTHPRLIEPPEITGQGFTAQKLQESGENTETLGGRPYEVVTYKTAITAARAGKFEIGPVRAKAQVVVPRRPSAPRSRPRSPFDLFDQDDPFSDPFFSNPFGQLGERREIEIKSEPVALEVKPLPPNAPPSFSGAIGNFTMATDAQPKTVQVGDPITVTAAISGRGNFDRVNAPALEDDRGWHKYPPSAKFKQDDEVGLSGTKTFEMVLSPNEKKQALPLLAFSYFDPVKGEYVTVRSERTPINVQGGAAVTQNAGANQPGSPTPATAARPSVQTAAKPADILYQLTDLGRARSFAPIYARTPFWIAQLAPLVLLLGFVGWTIRQTRIGDRERRRIAARQHEVSHLLRELRHGDVSPQVYFSQAARVVHLKTALARDINPNAVDAETIARTFDLNENERAQLRRLFERSDELSYSGTGNGAGKISKDEREEVLRFLENLRV